MLEANISNERKNERTISNNSDIQKQSSNNKYRRNSVITEQIKQSNDENLSHNIRIAKHYSKSSTFLLSYAK